ncbi:MAG: hypothetical protein RL266_2502 [Bacteroidota bacterium]|jgi:two-component system alkaline phosphatase synthesis response regulator PhoP
MNKQQRKVLIVDDEPDIIELVTYILEKEGIQVVSARNGLEGIEVAEAEDPDLVILDVMMPDMDGIEVCNKLRSMPKFGSTLISFLTARSEDYSQIAGFEAGADDYITKPIRPKTLVARINAILKRKRTRPGNAVDHSFGDLSIDLDKRLVTVGSKAIDLPKKEFDLLVLLCSDPEKVFSREEIFTELWNKDVLVGDRTIDVHIRKLRKKLGNDRIITLKGVGYRFKA